MRKVSKFIPFTYLAAMAFCLSLLGNTMASNCEFNNPSIPRGRPNVTSDYLNFDKFPGDNVEMPCIVKSNPMAKVEWFFNGKNIKQRIKENYYGAKPEVKCRSNLSTFKIWNIRYKNDQGNYMCVAQNEFGQSNYTFMLTILKSMQRDKPHIVNKKSKYVAYLGTSYNLTCIVEWPNKEPSHAAFYRRGIIVEENDRQELLPPPNGAQDPSFSKKYIMALKNVSKDDQGPWECRATLNDQQTTNKTFILDVVPCPVGSYCPLNESLPRPCPYGTYNDGLTNVTYRCKDCPDVNNHRIPKGQEAPAAKSMKECPRNTVDKPSYILFIALGIILSILIVVVLIVLIFRKRKRNNFNYMAWKDKILETEYNQIIYDVFISFSEKDHEFATNIRNKIEEKKYRCCYHHRDFSPGESIVKNITDAIYQSKITLVILSPDFMRSNYCKSELTQALTAAMESHRVLPVVYKQCKKLPLEIQSCLTYLEYKKEDEKHFWKKLFDALDRYCSRISSNETNV